MSSWPWPAPWPAANGRSPDPGSPWPGGASKKLPSAKVIRGYKGTLDFYHWKGIPVCRSWPHAKFRLPYPAEAANQARFAAAMKAWAGLDITVKQAWVAQAQGTTYRPQDLYLRAYLRGEA